MIAMVSSSGINRLSKSPAARSLEVGAHFVSRVTRFTVSERVVHWVTASAFFALLVSGLLLGRRGAFHGVM